jgi:hypothetical protein
MKKTRTAKATVPVDEIGEEYRFDYGRAKPNRFAGQPMEDQVVVVLDPDVSEVFQNPDSVNEVLRALIRTMPSRETKPSPKPRRARTAA